MISAPPVNIKKLRNFRLGSKIVYSVQYHSMSVLYRLSTPPSKKARANTCRAALLRADNSLSEAVPCKPVHSENATSAPPPAYPRSMHKNILSHFNLPHFHPLRLAPPPPETTLYIHPTRATLRRLNLHSSHHLAPTSLSIQQRYTQQPAMESFQREVAQHGGR